MWNKDNYPPFMSYMVIIKIKLENVNKSYKIISETKLELHKYLLNLKESFNLVIKMNFLIKIWYSLWLFKKDNYYNKFIPVNYTLNKPTEWIMYRLQLFFNILYGYYVSNF